MLFQESQYRNPRRGDPVSKRRLLFLVTFGLLVVAGGFALAPYFRAALQQAAGTGRGAGPDSAGREGAPVIVPVKRAPGGITPPSVLPPLPAPSPEAAPAPFEENPAILERVAAAGGGGHLDPEGLIYLLHQSRAGRGPAAGEAEAVEDGFEVWNELMRDPAGNQGRTVFLEGRLVTETPRQGPLYPVGLPAGNPSGLGVYYESNLFSGGKVFRVATWRVPGVPLEDGDAVRVRGRFLQRYEFDVAPRGQTARASVPVIVADAFISLPPPPPPGLLDSIAGNPEIQLLIGVAVVFIGGLLAAFWILRRGNRRFDEKIREVRERLGVHKGSRIGPGAGRFPPRGIPGGGDGPS